MISEAAKRNQVTAKQQHAALSAEVDEKAWRAAKGVPPDRPGRSRVQ